MIIIVIIIIIIILYYPNLLLLLHILFKMDREQIHTMLVNKGFIKNVAVSSVDVPLQ